MLTPNDCLVTHRKLVQSTLEVRKQRACVCFFRRLLDRRTSAAVKRIFASHILSLSALLSLSRIKGCGQNRSATHGSSMGFLSAFGALFCLLCLCWSCARAVLVNPSFEQDQTTTSSVASCAPGWTCNPGCDGVVIRSGNQAWGMPGIAAGLTAPDANYFFALRDVNCPINVKQTISIPAHVTQVAVSFWTAYRPGYGDVDLEVYFDSTSLERFALTGAFVNKQVIIPVIDSDTPTVGDLAFHIHAVACWGQDIGTPDCSGFLDDFSTQLTCSAGRAFDSDTNTCVCGAGYITNGAGGCNKCGLGEYSAAGATECTPCEAGKYNPGSGRSACIFCGAGKASDAIGADTSMVCVPCKQELTPPLVRQLALDALPDFILLTFHRNVRSALLVNIQNLIRAHV